MDMCQKPALLRYFYILKTRINDLLTFKPCMLFVL